LRVAAVAAGMRQFGGGPRFGGLDLGGAVERLADDLN
jgi:hypothetical protein